MARVTRAPLRNLLFGAIACALAGTANANGFVDHDNSITVRVGKATWRYEDADLRKMATAEIPNMRGTRKKPAIPLEALIYRDTGIDSKTIESVTVIPGDGMPSLLRGADLARLKDLVITTGPEKAGAPHGWALAPKSEEVYRAAREDFGSRRRRIVVAIDLVEKAE
jgi:hypothetical protein